MSTSFLHLRQIDEDVCRRHGIGLATFYKWKAPYGGLQVSKARRLRVLEAENARLKTLLADAALWGEVGFGMREFYEA
jgi:hypothetical protein